MSKMPKNKRRGPIPIHAKCNYANLEDVMNDLHALSRLGIDYDLNCRTVRTMGPTGNGEVRQVWTVVGYRKC